MTAYTRESYAKQGVSFSTTFGLEIGEKPFEVALVPLPRKFSDLEVCILAGGLSTRFGRDKSRARLGGRTLVGHIRAAVIGAGLRARVLRKDAVPRCGPLGGILTALRLTRAEAVIFLACDMPFVSSATLRCMARGLPAVRGAVFARQNACWGFPCVLPRSALPLVEAQCAGGKVSLQALAEELKARALHISASELFNINTAAAWAEACGRWQRRAGGKSGK